MTPADRFAFGKQLRAKTGLPIDPKITFTIDGEGPYTLETLMDHGNVYAAFTYSGNGWDKKHMVFLRWREHEGWKTTSSGDVHLVANSADLTTGVATTG